MEQKAQAGLEYLMTYGWALILITAIIGILVVIVSSPSSLVFSSSDPAKILLKAGNIDSQGNVTVILQNATGGKLNVTGIALSGDFTGSKLNGVETTAITAASPLPVIPGGELRFTDINYAGLGKVSAAIEMQYKDYADLSKSAKITANGATAATATPITGCGFTISSPGKYALANDLTCSGDGIIINSGGVVLNLNNKAMTGNTTGNGINVGDNLSYITVINGNIANFATGFDTGYESSNITLRGNTVKSNSTTGFYFDHANNVSFNYNISCCNTTYDLQCSETIPFTGIGNNYYYTKVDSCGYPSGVKYCTGVTC